MSGIDFYISLLTNHTQHAEIKECVSQHVSSIDTDSAGRLKLCQALADAGVTIELPAMNMIFEKDYDPEILEEAIAFYNTHKQANRIKCATLGWKGITQLIDESEKEETHGK